MDTQNRNAEVSIETAAPKAAAAEVAQDCDQPAAPRGAANADHAGDCPGIVTELGELPEGSVIYEADLARIFGKHTRTIDRAVRRGELPAPARLMGKRMWTAGVIRRHLEMRLESAKKDRETLRSHVRKLAREG